MDFFRPVSDHHFLRPREVENVGPHRDDSLFGFATAAIGRVRVSWNLPCWAAYNQSAIPPAETTQEKQISQNSQIHVLITCGGFTPRR